MDANTTKLEEIRQRAEAEPSGPRWTHSKYLHCVLGDDGFGVATLSQNRTGPTIEFISHSRSDIPYLLDLIQEQAAEIERLRAALGDAIELAAEGISYTPEYFVQKWGMQERLDALKATTQCVT